LRYAMNTANKYIITLLIIASALIIISPAIIILKPLLWGQYEGYQHNSSGLELFFMGLDNHPRGDDLDPASSMEDSLAGILDILVKHRAESCYVDSLPRHSPENLNYVNMFDPPPVNLPHSSGTNILIMGTDGNSQRRGRSDVLILLRICPEGRILSLSIPRDTRFTYQEGRWKGLFDKINHAYVRGGTSETIAAVENMMQLKIDHYLAVPGFKSFQNLLSLVGGVKVDKHLEGDLGTRWIRNRAFVMGDADRCKRHQIFMQNFIGKGWELTQGGQRLYTTLMIRIALDWVQTDLDCENITLLLNSLSESGFNPREDIVSGHLPGHYETLKSPIFQQELVFWIPNQNKMQGISAYFQDYRPSLY
ncbi:LCP family protein, partial [bacterium]|nr:LCP family protein [bacterium]